MSLLFVVIGLVEVSALVNETFYIYYDYYCAVCRIFKLTTATTLYDISINMNKRPTHV